MEEIAFIPTVANALLKEFVFLLLTLAFPPGLGVLVGVRPPPGVRDLLLGV